MAIRAIELAIIERAWSAGWVRPQPPSRPAQAGTHHQIAVVGSGPAGLVCAQQLARAGHSVTVYEGAEEIGGLLRYGIPDFRLEKWVLDRRLAQMRAEGVQFRTNTQVGVGLDSEDLLSDVDAVVLACGCSVPRHVDIPGRGLRGIHFALAYLTRQNRRVSGAWFDSDTRIDARGLDVLVIGGGDTGSDCVGTAIRQGHPRGPPVRGGGGSVSVRA